MRSRSAIAVLLLAGAQGLPSPAGAASPETPPASTASDETAVVWVRFRDHGPLERAPLAVRRAAARAQLSARSLERRRIRAGLGEPFENDLPVHDGYLDALRARGYRVRGASRWLNAASVAAPRHRLEELASLPFVASLEPVGRARRRLPDPSRAPERSFSPNAGGFATAGAAQAPGEVAFYGASWQQNRIIQADRLHAAGWTGDGVRVAILDTGFRETHVAFDSLQVVARRDFIHGDEIVDDQAGQDPSQASQRSHGTWTLSVLAGLWPGAHAGIAWKTEVALAKTEWNLAETPAEMDRWVMAMEWADSLGADVISSSLGYTTFDDPADSYEYADLDGRTTVVARAAAEAARRGITVVTAQGNSGDDPWHFLVSPADADSVCAVGAVDSTGAIGAFSSFGPSADGRVKPDVCALGLSVQLASPSSDFSFNYFGGTSFSTPAIAGLAALLLEAHPTWGPFEVLEALRSTADRFENPDDRFGFGIARGEEAMAWVPSTVDTQGPGPVARGRLDFVGSHPRDGGAPVLRLVMGSRSGRARLVLYDLRGRRVRTLLDQDLPAAAQVQLEWDGRDRGGRRAPAGLYLARLTAPGFDRVRRFVYMP